MTETCRKGLDAMYRNFYIVSGFLVTCFSKLRNRKTPIPEAEKLCPQVGLNMHLKSLVVIAILAAGSAPGACAQHHLHDGKAAVQAAPASQPALQGETVSLQGDQSVWIKSAEIHAFYDLSVASLGKNAGKVDAVAYRDKSYAIFRAFGTRMGSGPDAMVEHLKDIPQQMVGIVKDDPKVLDSYDNFVVALMGPQ